MKKYVVAVAALVLVAFATPAFAALNPFMDVPMNHWAYDAIGQLAAKGVLSGYPDGTYKGKQPTTRYEMASALARGLALVDLSKASKQDVEMLKKLCVEFKDELDALSVQVDALEVRVGTMESRLGGWRITGVLRQDLTQLTDSNIGGNSTQSFTPLARARLFVERWFGEDENIHFFTRIEGSNGNPYGAGPRAGLQFTRFYVDFPVWGGAQMFVGRQVYDAVEAPYFLDSGSNPFSKQMGMGTDSWLYDRALDAVALRKTFGAGTAWFYATHSEFDFNGTPNNATDNYGFWELYLAGQIQFSERFGFDLGVQYLFGDDSAKQFDSNTGDGLELSDIVTAFGGLRFDFNENIALKGMFYRQGFGGTRGNNVRPELQIQGEPQAWRAVIDVKQDMLKFTSLWLEFDVVDQGFFMPTGPRALFNNYDWAARELEGVISTSNLVHSDLTIWRIAAQQQWNDKWATFEYFTNLTANKPLSAPNDGTLTQWGICVGYQYNPSILFGLAWEQINFNDAWSNRNDPGQIRFRTQVTF